MSGGHHSWYCPKHTCCISILKGQSNDSAYLPWLYIRYTFGLSTWSRLFSRCRPVGSEYGANRDPAGLDFGSKPVPAGSKSGSRFDPDHARSGFFWRQFLSHSEASYFSNARTQKPVWQSVNSMKSNAIHISSPPFWPAQSSARGGPLRPEWSDGLSSELESHTP